MERARKYKTSNGGRALNDEEWFAVRTIQLQERNHAWHEMRSRSMQFTLWILGLAVAASWHLLQEPCDGLRQKLAVTGLVVALSLVSVYFLQALARGTKKNRDDPALNVNSLADRLGVHRCTLSKIFKKQKNISCIDYLIAVRTQRALSLIKETDLPISRMAEMTGFCSASYFIRTVKKAIGLSPKQFRKQ